MEVHVALADGLILGVREREQSRLGDVHLDQCYSKSWPLAFATDLREHNELVPKRQLADFVFHGKIFSAKDAVP